MKKARTFIIIGLIVFAWGCNKDDAPPTPKPDTVDKPDPEPEPENQAPGAFTLLSVKDKDTAVTLLPTFRWNTSTDPDGDMVDYDLLVGDATDNQNPVATDLNTATYNLDEPLKRFTDYYWSVVAKDSKGKETGSETLSFTTRNVNNPLNATELDAGFSPRLLHTVTKFNDRLFLFGGAAYDEIYMDLWSSDDGINWTEQEDTGLFFSRGHTSVVFRDTLWHFGGSKFYNNNSSRSRAMTPTNGYEMLDRNSASYEAPWQERELHTSAVFLDEVWVLGGVSDTNVLLNDVWSTEDVRGWDVSGEHDPANWSPRFGHGTVVFDDKLWVIGGNDGVLKNDVWYTEDGDEWTPVPQETPFPIRVSHQIVVFDDKIWMVGGNGETGVEPGIWYSADGSNWYELSEDYGFDGRIKPSLTVFKDQMLMIGGYDLTKYYNDVWVFD